MTTRRDFLTATAAALLTPTWLQATPPTLAAVLAQTLGIDMHNHVYPAGTEPHMQRGPQQPTPQSPEKSLVEEIRRTGLTAVCASFVLDFTPSDKPGDALASFLHWLTAIDAELAKGHIHRALTLKDFQLAHSQGQPTIVQSVEGAQFLEGHLDRIAQVYQRGVRHLQLLHMRDDALSPLGDVITSPPHLNGLTPFGAQVIQECNRLGILVDMAHATTETVLGALKVSTQPILYSHTGLDTRPGTNPRMAQMMKPHLIPKERAKAVADAGGVVGVWTKLADSPQAFVENVKAMADAIGIDHVGIGTDSDLLSPRPDQATNQPWPNMTAGFFPTIVAEMLTQGFTPADIAKTGGGNFCRVFGNATSHA